VPAHVGVQLREVAPRRDTFGMAARAAADHCAHSLAFLEASSDKEARVRAQIIVSSQGQV
jgi:hypothetical protein